MKFYYRKNGDVLMKSQGKLDCDLKYITHTLNNEEKKKIEDGYKMVVKRKKLIFVPTINTEKKERLEKMKDIKQNIDTANSVKDLKKELTELLTLLNY